MTRYWPFVLYAAVVVLHHVLLAVDPQFWTKCILMASLLVVVLAVGLWTDRGIVVGVRSTWIFILLCAAIVLSGLGDIILAFSFEVAITFFALAQMVYVGLFAGPGRGRAFPWWAIPYGLLYSPVIALLWGYLGPFGAVVAVYGLLLLAMAVTSVVVGATVAIGGLVFLVSEALLGIRMFVPEWLGWFPDPYQDVTISLLYCVGQGLIAFGMIRRLEREPQLAEERTRRRAELTANPYATTSAR